MRYVNCLNLKIEAEGLVKPPYPGALGQKIFENISITAWKKWLGQQTILINENMLVLSNPEHKKFLETEMLKFLFGTEEK